MPRKFGLREVHELSQGHTADESGLAHQPRRASPHQLRHAHELTTHRYAPLPPIDRCVCTLHTLHPHTCTYRCEPHEHVLAQTNTEAVGLWRAWLGALSCPWRGWAMIRAGCLQSCVFERASSVLPARPKRQNSGSIFPAQSLLELCYLWLWGKEANCDLWGFLFFPALAEEQGTGPKSPFFGGSEVVRSDIWMALLSLLLLPVQVGAGLECCPAA